MADEGEGESEVRSPSFWKVENLTTSVAMGRLPAAVCNAGTEISETLTAITKGLYRRAFGNVIVTGIRGVGKSTIVREVARRAAMGVIPFLQNHRFLWVDCRDVPPEDSRDCLEAIFNVVSSTQNVVLCLDGMASLLTSPEGSNKPRLRAILRLQGIQVIGVISKWEYTDSIGSDAEFSEMFARVEIEEPREVVALDIVQDAANRLQAEYALTIPRSVVERSIALASTFIMSEAMPAKGIKVLRLTCDEVDYARTQLAAHRSEVAVEDVVRVIANLTGIPEATIAGEGERGDLDLALREAVVGQPQAVQTVATELRLIKAGLTESNKPASVMLFAGMTGVGKTELAKRIAELYSSSKRLQVYPMGNFTEPHSVSGIIGVPPGYVGHDQGGRLINDLNADPYSVFLLDEAEKAHPNIWIPFLNLFDEGWITDQRGVKAHADRAIFILTTNAGGDAIAQMSQMGSTVEQIDERIKQTLSKIRQERSSQPVFTPQFLARIKRIVIFNALDQAAMLGISRKMIASIQKTWLRKREKQIVVDEMLMQALADYAHHLNSKSGGKEGGRIVRKLISDIVEHRIQIEATEQVDRYKPCHEIRIELSQHTTHNGDQPSVPGVTIEFV